MANKKSVRVYDTVYGLRGDGEVYQVINLLLAKLNLHIKVTEHADGGMYRGERWSKVLSREIKLIKRKEKKKGGGRVE